MKVDEMVARIQDTVTVRRVFSEPYERNGVTVIPAAIVAGGGGGGGGHDREGGEGEGGGVGVAARPAGAYVISGSDVRWRPAIDVNRTITAFAAVAIVCMLTHARVTRLRLRAR